jgi:hypothetical protein
VLRWAADMAVGWKGCTKRLSAISCQLDQRPRSRERGFFAVGKVNIFRVGDSIISTASAIRGERNGHHRLRKLPKLQDSTDT